MNKLNNSKKKVLRNQNAKKQIKQSQKIVNVPLTTVQPFRFTKPRISASKDGKSVCVSHRERCSTIMSNVGGTSFKPQSFRINAANSALFPWLSGVARRYESFHFKKLKFEYRTKTTVEARGDITMAVEYDILDPAPTTTIVMENWEDSANSALWKNFVLPCTKANLNKRKSYFTKSHVDESNNSSSLLSDVGTLYVAVEGFKIGTDVTVQPVGYLYCDYEVELTTPDLSSAIADTLGGHLRSGVGATLTDALGVGGGGPIQSKGNTGLKAMPRTEFFPIAQAKGYAQCCAGIKLEEPGDYVIIVSIFGSFSTYQTGLKPNIATNNLNPDSVDRRFTYLSSVQYNGTFYVRVADDGLIQRDQHVLLLLPGDFTAITQCHFLAYRVPLDSLPPFNDPEEGVYDDLDDRICEDQSSAFFVLNGAEHIC